MDFTAEEMEEIQKLQRTRKQLEGILKTSSNNEQRSRVNKDLKKIVTRLEELAPDGLPDEGPASAPESNAKPSAVEDFEVINKFTPQKVSEHCEDDDINTLATLMTIFEGEYWPALGESQMKLDFSHSSERDSFFTLLEESKRNLKILTETMEEHATATNSDFREQLFKMRNKQTRVYLYDTVKTMKRARDFLKILVHDLDTNGNIIMNKEETIKFNPELHNASLLNHRSIPNAVREIYKFADETVRVMNLPDLDG